MSMRYTYVLNNGPTDSNNPRTRDGRSRYDIEDNSASAQDRVMATGVSFLNAFVITSALNRLFAIESTRDLAKKPRRK